MLADCNTAALVDRAGSIDWLCLPRYDSDAVFARLLDPDAGHWSIRPVGAFRAERRYLPGTLVLETTFTTDTGIVRLIDALAFAEGQRGHDLGFDSPHQVLRAVEGVEGHGRTGARARAAPRVRAGQAALPKGSRRRSHVWGRRAHSRAGGRARRDRRLDDARRVFGGGGRDSGLLAGWAPPEARALEPSDASHVRDRLGDIAEGWRSWEEEHDIYEGPRRDLVRFSSRVLKGLTYRPTGAVVAAPTSSLPEDVGGERNWDYRYAWIRDASLTLVALYIGACSDEAEDFVSFMTSSAGGRAGEGSLQIMYGIDGRHDLSERELLHLRGWRDSAPVRVGNGAWDQVQLDVYGELLNALHLYRERLGELHPEIQAFIADVADTAARRWKEADSGIWEMRGEPAPPPVIEGDVLGRARPGREARAKSRRVPEGRSVERCARRDPSRRRGPRLEREEAGVRAGVRLGRPGRRGTGDADRGLPARDRSADALDDRRDRRRADAGRNGAALPQRRKA